PALHAAARGRPGAGRAPVGGVLHPGRARQSAHRGAQSQLGHGRAAPAQLDAERAVKRTSNTFPARLTWVLQERELGMKTGWLVGGLAAIVLIAGGAFFLMKGPAGSAPPTLFQWQDYVDPHFTAAYEAAYHEKPATSIFADEDEALAK